MNWLERLNRLPPRVTLPDANGVVIDIGHWAYNAHLPDNVPHRHAYFEVCRVGEHGSGQYLVEGVPHALRPGDLFFSRPGVLHQIVNTEQPLMELFWMTFHLQLPGNGAKGAGDTGGLTTLLRRFAEASEVLVVPDTSGSVRAAWEAIRTTASATTAAHQAVFPMQMNALSLALLIALALAGGGGEEADDSAAAFADTDETTARRAVRYIHDNLSRPLTVPEIAARISVSPRHLTRLFRRLTGVPPAAYIEKARLQRARTLLLKTDDPVKQIGAQVGYDDVHHFTRAFTRLVGCPPGTFRRTRGAAATPVGEGANIQNPGTLV